MMKKQSAPENKKAFKITPEMLAAASQPREPQLNPWTIPPPAPGVVPENKSPLAQDSCITDSYQYASGYAAQYGSYCEGLAFLGLPYLAELTQRPEYRRMSEIIAKEMTRKWISLEATGDEDKTEKITRLNIALKRFKIQDLFRRAAEHDGFFGRAHLFCDVGGKEKEDYITPLVISKKTIKQGTVRGFRVIDPLWTYPNQYNSINPLDEDYYRPQEWYVMGTRVHRSRLMTFVSREVPDILKPAYMFGGISLSQLAKPYVDNWLRTRQSVSDITHAFSIMCIGTDLSQALTPGGSEDFVARLELFNRCRDNRGVFIYDKVNEEFKNVSASLGSLDKLQAQAQEHMSSVCGIPLVKFLGITPSGLNASSDGEIRSFYDWIHAQQEHLFNENLKRVLDILQVNEFGDDPDPEIGFRFEPLWTLDEAAMSAIRKTNCDTAIEYINAGVLDTEEERTRIRNEEGSLYPGLDLNKVIESPESQEQDPEILSDPAHGLSGERSENSIESI